MVSPLLILLGLGAGVYALAKGGKGAGGVLPESGPAPAFHPKLPQRQDIARKVQRAAPLPNRAIGPSVSIEQLSAGGAATAAAKADDALASAKALEAGAAKKERDALEQRAIDAQLLVENAVTSMREALGAALAALSSARSASQLGKQGLEGVLAAFANMTRSENIPGRPAYFGRGIVYTAAQLGLSVQMQSFTTAHSILTAQRPRVLEAVQTAEAALAGARSNAASAATLASSAYLAWQRSVQAAVEAHVARGELSSAEALAAGVRDEADKYTAAMQRARQQVQMLTPVPAAIRAALAALPVSERAVAAAHGAVEAVFSMRSAVGQWEKAQVLTGWPDGTKRVDFLSGIEQAARGLETAFARGEQARAAMNAAQLGAVVARQAMAPRGRPNLAPPPQLGFFPPANARSHAIKVAFANPGEARGMERSPIDPDERPAARRSMLGESLSNEGYRHTYYYSDLRREESVRANGMGEPIMVIESALAALSGLNGSCSCRGGPNCVCR